MNPTKYMDYQRQMTQRRREAMARQLDAMKRVKPVRSDLSENLREIQREWERKQMLQAALGIVGFAIAVVALAAFAVELGLL